MNRKVWTAKQIKTTFKMKGNVSKLDLAPRLASLVRNMEFDGCDRLLDNEAKEVAERMMGTAGWQGMLAEYRTFSGLKSRINASLKYGWKVTEQVYGDGFSIYYLSNKSPAA